MPSKHRPRKCRSCHNWFQTDPRSHPRQHYCSEIPCQKERKAAGQKRRLAKNPAYWSDPQYVKKTQLWRIKKKEEARLKTSSHIPVAIHPDDPFFGFGLPSRI